MPNHVVNILLINADSETSSNILENIKNNEIGIGSFDFNKLIPMPKSLDIESSSTTDKCIELYLTAIHPLINYFNSTEAFKKVSANEFINICNKMTCSNLFGSYTIPMPLEEINAFVERQKEHFSIEELLNRGKQAVDNVVSYGCKDWYDWSLKNWGTKWNAYDFEMGEKPNQIIFHTAWSAPHPVLKMLSQKYPETCFSHSWAEEDIAVNLGKQDFLNGEIVGSYIPEEHSKEAYDLAFELLGGEPKDWNLRLNKDGTNYEFYEKDEEDDLES